MYWVISLNIILLGLLGFYQFFYIHLVFDLEKGRSIILYNTQCAIVIMKTLGTPLVDKISVPVAIFNGKCLFYHFFAIFSMTLKELRKRVGNQQQ